MSIISLLLPVDDMGAAVHFLSEQIDLSPKFQDGNRYTGYAAITLNLALLGLDERIAPDASIAVRVTDLGTILKKWVAAGAETVRSVEQGPHELRAVVRIPGGLLVTLVQKQGV